MENNLNFENNLVNKPHRSQFLTVLCILTFIMCAIGIIGGIYNIYSSQPEVMQQKIEQIQELSPQTADYLTNQMIELQGNSFMKIYPYLNLVFILLSFTGAMMMWNFKKKGFYLYSIAEILPYCNVFFISKDAMNIPGIPTGSASIMIIITIIVDLVFVFLYSRNLKELK